MLSRLLRQALRSPLPELAGGFRFWRQHGAPIRRARALCQCADGLRLRRPRGWDGRSRRLYQRTVITLGELAPPPTDRATGDPAWAARRALRQASLPYRGFLAALSRLCAWALVATLVGLAAAYALSPRARARLFPRDLAAGRPWSASSGALGFAASGVGPASPGSAFFHTEVATNPAVEIDLGGEHVVRSVLVENRADCCQARALPLDVEVWDGNRWRLVAERRAAFKVWRYDVGPVRTSKLRFRRPGSGYFHLKRISVYGQ